MDHPRGYKLLAIVGAYRLMAGGVDQCNTLALGTRGAHGHMTWSRALRSFVVRYAFVTAFCACKEMGLIPDETTMWGFQMDLLKEFVPPSTGTHNVQYPFAMTGKMLCAHCKMGRALSECFACGIPLCVRDCFAAYHGVWKTTK